MLFSPPKHPTPDNHTKSSPMKYLLVTPPLTQLNTPYPATTVLKGFLQSHGMAVDQADLGIELVNRIYTRPFLQQIFQPAYNNTPATDIAHSAAQYINCVETVMHFLQGRANTFAPRIANRSLLPEGPRFRNLADMEWAFGTSGTEDKARYLATLFVEDIADYIRDHIDPHFDLIRYAEQIASFAPTFDPIEDALHAPLTLIDKAMLSLFQQHVEQSFPQIVGFSIPFPGCLYGALRCSQWLRQQHPDITVVFGGGFPNTEWRQLSEPRLFQYCHYITLDDGEEPLLRIGQLLEGKIAQSQLLRTLTPSAMQLPAATETAAEAAKAANFDTPNTQVLPPAGADIPISIGTPEASNNAPAAANNAVAVGTPAASNNAPAAANNAVAVGTPGVPANAPAAANNAVAVGTPGIPDNAPAAANNAVAVGTPAVPINAPTEATTLISSCPSSPSPDETIPDFEGLPLQQYLSLSEMTNPMHRLWSNGRWNKLMMAHGCYWAKCAFCDTSLDYIGRYKAPSASLVVDRMQHIAAQTGISGFHFVDEALPPTLLREVCQEILRRGLTFSFWGNIRFEKAYTQDLCNLLADAGCVAVSGGLEVASDRLLKLMNKGVTIQQTLDACRHFKQAGIMVHTYLMYGFPTETLQETINALEVVRKMFDEGIVQSAFWHRYAMTCHSPSGHHPELFGARCTQLTPNPFCNNEVDFELLPANRLSSNSNTSSASNNPANSPKSPSFSPQQSQNTPASTNSANSPTSTSLNPQQSENTSTSNTPTSNNLYGTSNASTSNPNNSPNSTSLNPQQSENTSTSNTPTSNNLYGTSNASTSNPNNSPNSTLLNPQQSQNTSASQTPSSAQPNETSNTPASGNPVPQPFDYDIDAVGEGLRFATYNYMNEIGLDMPIKRWFTIKVPKPQN